MKRIIAFILCISLLLSLCACDFTARTDKDKDSGKSEEQDNRRSSNKDKDRSEVSKPEIAYPVYMPDIDNIVTDTSSNISYVNNMVIIVFAPDADEDDIETVIQSIDGKIAGSMEAINQYQIQIGERSLEELKALVEAIEENDCVLFAHYDRAYQNPTAVAAPNDPWNGDTDVADWSDADVDGSNWWQEAIDLYGAWQYHDSFSEITIGIVDNGFDTAHEDLRLSFPEDFKTLNSKEDHGTHVAGIIGATADNGKGITGIVEKSDLLCFDWQPTWWQDVLLDWQTETMVYAGLIYLVESGAKVINFSLQTAGNFPNGNIYTRTELDDMGRTASGYLAVLLSGPDDFIVVQAAGNGGVDAENAGFFASVTEYNCVTWGSGNASVEGICDRILVVGAMEQAASGYMMSSFSDGSSQVDLAAPGGNGSGANDQDIYSCVTGGFRGSYAALPGTSMAAPMVAGVAALVWSVSEDFTGAEVAKIIRESTVGIAVDNPVSPLTTGDFGILNAKNAVESAILQTTGTLQHNGHTYQVFSDTSLTWEEAAAYCTDLGGHLVTITTPEEQAFINTLLLKTAVKNCYWTGGIKTGDQWTWVTGEEFSCTNWAANEPNNEGGTENYLHLFGTEWTGGKGIKYVGNWNDASVDGAGYSNEFYALHNFGFICEWE